MIEDILSGLKYMLNLIRKTLNSISMILTVLVIN